jgi:hypothetical protein
MPSKDADQKRKTVIIERLFDRRWNTRSKSLTNELVTIDDLRAEIDRFDRKVPKGLEPFDARYNIYAFFKDFVRVAARANRNWPESISRRGYTARQETGGGKSFRFIRIPVGQTTPFIEPPSTYPRLKSQECRFKLQSLSLDLETRLVGFWGHESWLMQVAVQLRLIQSHLALCSEHQFLEVADLQQNIKQGRAEIDGLFLGRTNADSSMLITVEAKGRTDDILESQVAAQVTAVMRNKNIKKNLPDITKDPQSFYILPLAMKVIDESVVYIAEYEPVRYEPNATVEEVNLKSESLCEIVPPVEGIG